MEILYTKTLYRLWTIATSFAFTLPCSFALSFAQSCLVAHIMSQTYYLYVTVYMEALTACIDAIYRHASVEGHDFDLYPTNGT